MAKGVFVCRVEADYDDIPEIRYHFPSTYLRAAEGCVGDWILYYEPRRNRGRQCYVATARVARIERDPRVARHYYAFVDDYLELPEPVPFREGDIFYESALRRPDGSVNLGLFQRSIHHIPDHEYELILRRGLGAPDWGGEPFAEDSLDEAPVVAEARPLIEQVLRRPFRDRAFSRVIRAAYGSACALTDLRLVNGSGLPEVEAAHIRSVEDGGPDSPRNGLALSRTVHWLFDRGVLTLEDDGRILRADRLAPPELNRLLRPDGYARFPENTALKPHREFLRWHRETLFRG